MKHMARAGCWFLYLLLPMLSAAEEMYLPELRLLYAADMVVEASYVKSEGDHFWIKVKTVYKNGAHQVKVNDFLRIQQLSQAYGIGYYDFSMYNKARYYLQFKDHAWQLYGSTTQAAKRILNDTVRFDFQFTDLALPVDEFNTAYKEFIALYQLDSTGRYVSPLDPKRQAALEQSNIFVKTYESDFIEEVVEPTDQYLEPSLMEVLWSCGIADVPAVYNGNGTMEQLGHYLKDSLVNPPQVRELGIEGVSVIRFTVNTDGSQSDFEILRSLGPTFDEEVLRLVNKIPVWKPAKNRGYPVACKMMLPFRFRLQNE